MVPKRYSSEGIILARRSYSEADRILVVYTKYYGKLHIIAKGIRKPKSRKRGSLEVFSHIKFSAAKGKSLDIVTEVEMIESFPEVRKDLKKVSIAYFLMETIGRVTKEEEENRELFSLILKYLKKLRRARNLKKLRKEFIEETLILLGYWPKGKELEDPDKALEEVTERKMTSVRVGKKMLS